MNPKIKHSRDRAFKRFVYIFFFLMCACFVLPLIVVISASFTSEQALTSGGFSLLPRDFTLDAYKSAFSSGTRVLRAYGVTIFQAVVGTVLSSLVAALAAYPLSRSNFRFRRPITVFIFFTMLFSAGMIPNYIIFAKYYKLADSIWIYILPGITGGAWNTMVFRTFFKGLPETLFEAAYLDGASELRIFFSVVLPLSTPVFASLGFMALVARWNDYTTSMIYIRNESLYTLQYLLVCIVLMLRQSRGAVRIACRVRRLHTVIKLPHERVTVEQILFRVIDRLSGIVLRPDQVERAEILKRNAEFPFEIRVNGFHIVNVLRHLGDGKQRRKHSKFGAFRAVVAPHSHDDIFNALCVAGFHCLAHSRDAERVVRRKARPCPKSAREPRTAFDCVVGVNISLIALPVAAKIIPVHQVNILRHQLSDFLRNFAELRVLIEIGKVIPARQTEEHIAPHQKLEAIFFRHF